MHYTPKEYNFIKTTKIFAEFPNLITFAPGEMAEWSNAAVLKTVDLNGSGGSNPSFSAKTKSQNLTKRVNQSITRFFLFFDVPK